MNVDQNRLCLCGSGKKYKDCCPHLITPEESGKFGLNYYNKLKNHDAKFGITVVPQFNLFPPGSSYKTLSVIHPVVRFSIRADLSFYNWLIEYLLLRLELKNTNFSKSKSYNNHEIVKLLNTEEFDFNQEISQIGNDRIGYLIRMAWDLFNVEHFRIIPENKISKLRSNANFYSTKYEIHVASLFARMGCQINWIPTGVNRTHEFSVCIGNDVQIAVEVKNKNSSKLMLDRRDQIKSIIKDNIKYASTQIPKEMAGIIFINLNLRPSCERIQDSKRFFEKMKYEASNLLDVEGTNLIAVVIQNYVDNMGYTEGDILNENFIFISEHTKFKGLADSLSQIIKEGISKSYNVPYFK